MAYLTPNEAPDGVDCRALFIPNTRDFLAIVRGALLPLTYADSWIEHGSLTPDECAAYMFDMVDRFLVQKDVCRMIGEIVAYAGSTAPDSRFLVCDGSEVLQADYPALYALIGDTYGAAITNYFKLPDLRGRSISGVGTGAGLSAVSLGQAYGEESHTLTIDEIPSHNHDYLPPTLNLDLESPGAPDIQAAGIGLPDVTGSRGGSGAHNTVGPRLGVNYLIYAKDA